MKMLTIYHGRHYWVNTCNKFDDWIEWESLDNEIKKLERVRDIEESHVSLLLFERRDMISDDTTIEGYIHRFERSQFDFVPQALKGMFVSPEMGVSERWCIQLTETSVTRKSLQ